MDHVSNTAELLLLFKEIPQYPLYLRFSLTILHAYFNG